MNKEIANKIERNLALLTLAQIMEFIKNIICSVVFTTLHKNPHSYINIWIYIYRSRQCR